MNRSELQELAQARLSEAKALLAADLPTGAYYLAGYAVECALKSCIAKSVREHDFPDKGKVLQSYSHNFVDLIKAAELDQAFKDALDANAAFASNWAVVKDWKAASRYSATRPSNEARDIVDAISDPEDGVLQWLTLHW